MSSVEVVTFGCRLNIVESEAMKRAALDAGQDNLIIVNTCAVTAEASRQARQTIRRLRRENPDKQIVVTGCGAQVEPEIFAAMPEVTRLIGNGQKTNAAAWALGEHERVSVNDIMELRETASHFLDGVDGHTRAFVQVQNGCDHRCTFCIIPFGRGPSRSAPMGEIVREIKRLATNNYREIVLTGVDLTSYGSDLPGTPKLGFLVREILRHVPHIERLRLSSIDCIEADDQLLRAFAEEPRLMPHLHLSLQAGDNMILKRMKRRHSRDESVKFCADLRKIRPDIVFGADLIAGFPTETDEMFENTLKLVQDCGLTHLHVFPFSPRPGTPAAKMPQVAKSVAKERAKRLRDAGEAALQNHLAAQTGKILRVLFERGGMARAEDFTPLRLEGIAGTFGQARVTGHNGKELLAEVI